jgi:hypothetical protein
MLLTIGAPGGRDLEALRARLVKIGALTESWGSSTTIVGLRDGLQERGYRENKDFVIGVRFTQGFFVDGTGLASYGANSYELGRQAAHLVEKILTGRSRRISRLSSPRSSSWSST